MLTIAQMAFMQMVKTVKPVLQHVKPVLPLAQLNAQNALRNIQMLTEIVFLKSNAATFHKNSPIEIEFVLISPHVAPTKCLIYQGTYVLIHVTMDGSKVLIFVRFVTLHVDNVLDQTLTNALAVTTTMP